MQSYFKSRTNIKILVISNVGLAKLLSEKPNIDKSLLISEI